MTGESGFDLWQSQTIFLFPTSSRQALVSIHPPIEWINGGILPLKQPLRHHQRSVEVSNVWSTTYTSPYVRMTSFLVTYADNLPSLTVTLIYLFLNTPHRKILIYIPNVDSYITSCSLMGTNTAEHVASISFKTEATLTLLISVSTFLHGAKHSKTRVLIAKLRNSKQELPILIFVFPCIIIYGFTGTSLMQIV